MSTELRLNVAFPLMLNVRNPICVSGLSGARIVSRLLPFCRRGLCSRRLVIGNSGIEVEHAIVWNDSHGMNFQRQEHISLNLNNPPPVFAVVNPLSGASMPDRAPLKARKSDSSKDTGMRGEAGMPEHVWRENTAATSQIAPFLRIRQEKRECGGKSGQIKSWQMLFGTHVTQTMNRKPQAKTSIGKGMSETLPRREAVVKNTSAPTPLWVTSKQRLAGSADNRQNEVYLHSASLINNTLSVLHMLGALHVANSDHEHMVSPNQFQPAMKPKRNAAWAPNINATKRNTPNRVFQYTTNNVSNSSISQTINVAIGYMDRLVETRIKQMVMKHTRSLEPIAQSIEAIKAQLRPERIITDDVIRPSCHKPMV